MKKIHKSINIFMLCASLIGAGWMLPDYAQAEVAEVQQSSVATGTVVDESGEPVYGARITVVGTKTMVLTDAQGKFKISNVRKGASLLVSYIGHKSQTVKWDGAALRIQLEESSSTLNEAVVTAMGIVRKEKSLTYATQQIKSDDLMKVQDPNVANSLEGKISGITITPSAGGAGGASQIVLRGSKSILGGSSPLIVVDGVPMTNETRGRISDEKNLTETSSAEGSDPLSMINPDDIESMNVLKGANAAALYGSRAANGVIMITTKKGKEGKLSVNYTGNVTFDTPLLLPEIQQVYGASLTSAAGSSIPGATWLIGEANGWGDKITNTPTTGVYAAANPAQGIAAQEVHMRNFGNNDVNDFYKTGWTTNNSLSFSGGTEKIQSYVSFANSHSNGMIENNNYNRNTFAFRQTYKLWDRLKIDASLNYTQTKTKNRMGGGTVGNPMYHLYMTPNNVDMGYYRDNYSIANGNWLSGKRDYFEYDNTISAYKKVIAQVPLSGLMQNWVYMAPRQNNPYWLMNQNQSVNREDRVNGSMTGTVDIIKGLSFQARVSFDHFKYDSEGVRFATTWGPADIYDTGTYHRGVSKTTELYTDFLLSYNNVFAEDWSVSATAGYVGHTTKGNSYSTYLASATYIYSDQPINTINMFMPDAGDRGVTSSSNSSNWDKAALFTAQLGWKEKVYVDFSYRQDWYRVYRQFKNAGKPTADNYGYFGFGANALLNELIRLPKWWDYAKFRVSYSEVGNSIPNSVLNTFSTNTKTGAISGTIVDYANPLPETTKSFETGLEMLFLENNLNFDFTYYHAIMTDLYMNGSNASGKAEPINSGKIRNTGFETTLGYHFRLARDLRWKTAFNFSYNENKILETANDADGSEKLFYKEVAGVRVRYRKGGSVGDMYVRDIRHNADGTIFLTESGNMIKENRYTKYIGNMNSKYQLGWNNTFTYKDFQLSFLINGRIGGKVISLTEAYLDEMGLSQRTADARLAAEQTGLKTATGELAMYLPDGSGQIIGIENYYKSVGARGNQYSPNYVYDATNFRLRELSLAYTFRNLVGEGKNLSLSFIARNLFFIYKEAPVDPDISLSTVNGLGGFECFNMPSSRSFGFNVKLNF